MPVGDGHQRLPFDEDAALRAIVEGTATETGEGFFAALVQSLARAVGVHGAWVTEYRPAAGRLRALAFWLEDPGTPFGRFLSEESRQKLAGLVGDLGFEGGGNRCRWIPGGRAHGSGRTLFPVTLRVEGM